MEMIDKKAYHSHVKYMEKMLKVLQYMLHHLDEDLNVQQVAAEFDYNQRYFERIFTDYFKYPFHKYFRMLRLRKAAERLIVDGTVKNDWKRYGFGCDAAFSRAFKNEFGITQREFMNTNQKVPPMPEKAELFGVPIEIHYEKLGELNLIGYPMPLIHGNDTDLLREASYALEHEDENLRKENLRDWYGIWWYDFKGDNQLYYLVAVNSETVDEQFIKNGSRREGISILSDHYAVFSYDKRENESENLYFSRLLARYALLEWKFLTDRKPNNMGWTFERFGEKRNYLYVPVIDPAMDEGGLANNYKRSGVDSWANYIDRHIEENLTLSVLADMAHYTIQSFQDIFTMYYAIEPLEYVRKRRLYEVAAKLEKKSISKSDHPKKLEQLAKRYHFSSLKAFRMQFREEFQMEPEDYAAVNFRALDLNQYYQDNKDRMRVSNRIEEGLRFIGRSVHKTPIKKNYMDIAEMAAFWFRDSFADLETVLGEGLSGDKAAIWDTFEADDGEKLYQYMVGPILKGERNVSAAQAGEEYHSYELPGGRYMVFETLDDSDEMQLTYAFRLLTRCAFFGWIRKNMYRYDGNRLTYVKYVNEKLYFYVPIKG